MCIRDSVGAGAGFPGIVTKIYKPELELTLMEPTGKRVECLKYACAQLGLTGVEFAKAVSYTHLRHGVVCCLLQDMEAR